MYINVPRNNPPLCGCWPDAADGQATARRADPLWLVFNYVESAESSDSGFGGFEVGFYVGSVPERKRASGRLEMCYISGNIILCEKFGR